MIARNRCCECGHEWQDRPVGFAVYQACPNCGSSYWAWTNYDDSGEPGPGPKTISLKHDATEKAE